ncbi:MAG: CTP-dependent riboflavin kinase [Thaumarchaeota archaeon]|nr:CTP-dependent riboflavin kinase [Nitrososphaerota archaeon]
MSDLKVQHILTLAELLSKGARHNFVSVTTSSLGNSIHRSQQAASKHLLELERDGYIERIRNGQKFSVRITPKGHAEMVKVSTVLKSSLESSPSYIEFMGNIISGMGEGAYYMSMKGYTKQFKSKLGYIPFPGTLNVKLKDKKFVEAKHELDAHEGIKIDSFSDGKRTYGWVKCYPAKINNSVDGMIITLERTHYDDSILELISHTSIKKAAKLSTGSQISIRVPVSSK